MFKATVFDLQPDIIGVTESWVTDKIFDSELHLDNYRTFRCDRQTGNRGGGVLLYIKDDLNPTEFHVDTEYDEQVWCYIGDLLVGVCYRSSNLEIVGQDNETNLMKMLHEVCNKHVLIMGDFNYPAIDWSTYDILLIHQAALEVTNLCKPLKIVFTPSTYTVSNERLGNIRPDFVY